MKQLVTRPGVSVLYVRYLSYDEKQQIYSDIGEAIKLGLYHAATLGCDWLTVYETAKGCELCYEM